MHAVAVRHPTDRILLFYIAILLIFGLAALASASAAVGVEKFNDSYFFVKRQILYGVLPGLAFFLLLLRISSVQLRRVSVIVYGIAVASLVLVFIPGIGTALNGAHSWLSLGFFNFQPSEFAKLAVILMSAYLLSDERRDIFDWQKGVLPILLLLSPVIFLVLMQPDIGTLSILVMILFVQFFIAEIPARFLFLLGVAGALVFVGLIIIAPYRVGRITTFLHPELDPQGRGYQINQAFLAIGSGGFWGRGYGHSLQKFQYLPEVAADSIYAVIGEEMGFLFAGGLIVLILLIGWRGLRIARACDDRFSRLLVSGIVVWFVWQSFLNTGAMVGVLPLTGVPLPLISHGGSATMMMLIAFGVVASVSREANL